ncbi:Glucose-6-phosphate 1-dehydrogenase, cytoplasmic isoform [Camellia lanceoleosa]|uniref:Glucose-6-phosphate 1-dehydrogenase, cytoplasmic isoform n=1 Tax=Camellia lanceoleosa TaxID=1840588 RepID=A0ACC0G685_9ERIC|nr:Glucose-6-phosphate 1-dehydrogenase, cytoplasmic isoform [Camellia lanceoleosa]
MSNSIGHNLIHHNLLALVVLEHQSKINSSCISGYNLFQVQANLQIRKSHITSKFWGKCLNLQKMKLPMGTNRVLSVFPQSVLATDPTSKVGCLVAMEKLVSLKPEHIRDEKVKLPLMMLSVKFRSFNQCSLLMIMRLFLDNTKSIYTDDPTVPDNSNTPTFATVVLRIHNERWEGVPFIMKAGKALNSRKAEIRVQFKDVPGDIFKCKKQGRNEFVIRLQPLEAMYMRLTVWE